MDEPLPERCHVKAWRPPVDGIAEVFHARFVDFGYPLHCHDTWTVLIIDDGAISYALDQRSCGAVGQTVAILPPGVPHDGRPADGAVGFTKRVLYLDESVLPMDLVGAAVDKTNIHDPDLRASLAALHRRLARGEASLAADGPMALITERLTRHLANRSDPRQGPEDGVAVELREMLDAASPDSVSLAAAAVALERSKAHLVRSFSATYGISPHAYLVSRRVESARRLLLEGTPPAEAAVLAGFHDQSHLTRHFKRHTSLPPGTYARSWAAA